ncbi:hypothetical protein [Mesorhizobium sp.]|nr:hypothetical protein [Mesorhizobium sp.]
MSFDLIVKGGILPDGNTTEPKGSVFLAFASARQMRISLPTLD